MNESPLDQPFVRAGLVGEPGDERVEVFLAWGSWEDLTRIAESTLRELMIRLENMVFSNKIHFFIAEEFLESRTEPAQIEQLQTALRRCVPSNWSIAVTLHSTP